MLLTLMVMNLTLQGVLCKNYFNINSIGTGSWSEGGCKGYVEP